MRDDRTFIYIISHFDRARNKPKSPVKIGISSNPTSRIRTLQTGNPDEILMLACFMCPTRPLATHLETMFHEVQDEKRLKGEWFDIAPMDSIELLCMYFRMVFFVHLRDDKKLMKIALRKSGVISSEKKVAKWRAHSLRAPNDNGAQQ